MYKKHTSPSDSSQVLSRLSRYTTDSAAEITKELYGKNVELAIRNRTLSLLQQIYEIINTSLGTHHTAQRLIDDIVKELSFQTGFIALVDRKRKLLITEACASTKLTHKPYGAKLAQIVKHLEIPLSEKKNPCIKTIRTGEKSLTHNLFDIIGLDTEERVAQELQEANGIQTSLIYPITFAKEIIGVLVIGLNKPLKLLSVGEKEALRELVEVIAIAIERAQMYVDLKKANARLKELDQLKDEFVSLASHELRTPMTAIRSYLWLAKGKMPKSVDPDVQKYLDISYQSTDRLIQLVNEMLTVSRIERGKIELRIERMSINELMQQVFDELKIRADEQKIEFNVHDEAPNTFVKGDKDKLREVFINIIGNALKFTPEKGKITISLKHEGKNVSISVTDTGPGIAKENLDKLFQKFSKIDYSYSKKKDIHGTGLGLYISKQIISLHHGDIIVQSQVDVGTTFTVVLPA